MYCRAFKKNRNLSIVCPVSSVFLPRHLLDAFCPGVKAPSPHICSQNAMPEIRLVVLYYCGDPGNSTKALIPVHCCTEIYRPHHAVRPINSTLEYDMPEVLGAPQYLTVRHAQSTWYCCTALVTTFEMIHNSDR